MKPDPVYRAKRVLCTLRWKADNPIKARLMKTKARCRRNKIPFNLTLDDIIRVPDVCPILGIPLYWPSGIGAGMYAGIPTLDRMIPSLGYVKGNVQLISWRANRLKSNASLAEIDSIAAYMRRHLVDNAGASAGLLF